MTKFDKIGIILSAIDTTLAITLLNFGEHPVLAAALSAAGAANFTQVLCNISLRKAEKKNQALSDFMDLILENISVVSEEGDSEDEKTEKV